MSRIGSRPPTRDVPTRRSSKAQYRPQVAPQMKKAGTVAKAAVRLRKKQDAPPPPKTSNSQDSVRLDVVRDWWRFPDDPQVAEYLGARASYLQHVGVEDIFRDLCKKLLTRAEFPYNPYPGFVKRLSKEMERFQLLAKPEEEVIKALNNPIKESHIPYIFCPRNVVSSQGLWGLPTVLQVVDPLHLSNYAWTLQQVTPARFNLQTQHLYSNQVMMAVAGPSMFSELGYQMGAGQVKVMAEYLISGPRADEAIKLFIGSILKDVLHMDQHTKHLVIGVKLAEDMDLWTMDIIQDRRMEFKQSLEENIIANKPIILECVLQLSESVHRYQPAQKVYSLNFVEAIEDTGEEKGVLSFTEFPMLTIHEGVFMNKTEVESYMAAFTSQMTRGEARQSHSWEEEDEERADRAVMVDGFRYGPDVSYNPYAWQITTVIKADLQLKLLGCHPVEDLLDVAYNTLLMVLMDRPSYDELLLVELYSLLRGCAAKLSALQQLNKCLQQAAFTTQDTESKLMKQLFLQYKQGLEDLLANKHQEYSSDIVTASKVIQYHLSTIPEDSTELINQTLMSLDTIYNYCQTLQLHFNETALQLSPTLKGFIETLKRARPEDVPRPTTRARDHKDHKKRKQSKDRGVRAVEGERLFIHGLEDENILKHDKMVVNLEMAVEKSSAPKLIAVESVLMKYIVDTHLDKMWAQYLADVLSGTHLPPNPYPRLASTLRKAAMKMDLWYESDEKVIQKVLHGAVRPEDEANHVSHIPGSDVHGVQSALSIVDTSTFFKLIPYIHQFIQTDFIQRKGPYRVAICCSVSGHSALYGQMSPYLPHLRLDEHCYIRGPDGCAKDGLQIYSKIVYEHVAGLHNYQQTPVIGVSMGSATWWSIHDIMNQKKGFAAQLEHHCQNIQPITMKAYVLMGWRYVQVIKHLCFHYITSDGSSQEKLFPHDQAAFYQNVFLDKTKAAFHFQYGGPAERSSPWNMASLRLAARSADLHILEALDKQDWMNVHRWLLTKNLFQQGRSHVADTWRMLHSIAAQAEYVIELGRALRDLAEYILGQYQRGSRPLTDQPQQEGSVDLGLLGRMALAFRQKTFEVLSTQVAMAPKCMADVVDAKLQQVMERDGITQEVFLAIEHQTLRVLDEVCGMLRCIQDMTSAEVHAACVEAQAAVRSIVAEHHNRPTSVESVHLTDPHIFSPLPQANYYHDL